MKYMVIRFRIWLLRKLSMGRPVVMNVGIEGVIDVSPADEWWVVTDCYIDARSGVTVVRAK